MAVVFDHAVVVCREPVSQGIPTQQFVLLLQRLFRHDGCRGIITDACDHLVEQIIEIHYRERTEF